MPPAHREWEGRGRKGRPLRTRRRPSLSPKRRRLGGCILRAWHHDAIPTSDCRSCADGRDGSVVVRFRICADGALDQASLMLPQPPRTDLLGDSALRTVREAAPFGPPPAGVMSIEVPIVFLMR